MRILVLYLSLSLFSTTSVQQPAAPYTIKTVYTARDRAEYAAQIMKSAIAYKIDNNISLGDTVVEVTGNNNTILFIRDFERPKFRWPLLVSKDEELREELIRRGFKTIIFQSFYEEICIYNLETGTIHFENLVDVNYKHGSMNAERYI